MSRREKKLKTGEGGRGVALGEGVLFLEVPPQHTPALRPTHNANVRRFCAEHNHWGYRPSAQSLVCSAAVGDVELHFDFLLFECHGSTAVQFDRFGWPEWPGIDSYTILFMSKHEKNTQGRRGGAGGGVGRECFVPRSATPTHPCIATDTQREFETYLRRTESMVA